MTKRRSTKRALVTSALSLLLCISMLMGSTYAWFTDEVTSTGNKIEAGTLEIDMLVRDADGNYVSIKESQDAIFDYSLWEPGYTTVANVKVENTGSLALQYNLQIVTEGLVEEMLNQKTMLSDVIDVYYAAKEVIVDDRAAFEAAVAEGELKLVGTLTEAIFGGTMVTDTLLFEEADYATIVLKMRESADNKYQGLSVGTKFDLKLYATQYTEEADSFDNQYDDIELPAATMMVAEPEILQMYSLDAGCVYLSTEGWDDSWKIDETTKEPAEGTPAYAFYFADFIAEVEKTDDVILWGAYGEYGEQEFAASLEAGVPTNVIPLADAALPFDMGKISYKWLVEQVELFACGVKNLDEGNTITVTLRLYETSLTKENGDGTFSFEETGAFHDIAVYTYTK